MRKAKIPHVPELLRDAIFSAFDQRDIVPDHDASGHWYRKESTGERAASVTTKQSLIKGYKQWAVDRAVDHFARNAERYVGGDALVADEARMAHVQELGEAAEIGTNAHGAYDSFLSEWISSGRRPAKSAADFLSVLARGEEVAACRSFDRFLNSVEIIPVASEFRVWYKRGKDTFAGTVDSLFLVLTPRKGRSGDSGVVALDGAAHTEHDYVRQDSGVLWCPPCGREVDTKLVLGDHKTSNSIEKEEYAEQVATYGEAIEVGAGIKLDELWIIRYSKKFAEYQILRIVDRKRAFKRFLSISRAFDDRMDTTPMLAPLIEKNSVTI